MAGVLEVIFRPKSILGFIIAAGIVFLLIAGLTINVDRDVHNFFLAAGIILLAIGLPIWGLYIYRSLR